LGGRGDTNLMTELTAEHLELIDSNKHKILQQKRMQSIITTAKLLTLEELHYIHDELGDLISNLKRKK